jgi:hypothetical protein
MDKIKNIAKSFNTDYEYSFWFYKSKFEWILEMLALVIDYDFTEGELEGMLNDLSQPRNDDPSKWSGGLHYGESGSMYINMALDAENRDIVNISISTMKIFQPQIEFIDKLQCTYEGFHKYRTY